MRRLPALDRPRPDKRAHERHAVLIAADPLDDGSLGRKRSRWRSIVFHCAAPGRGSVDWRKFAAALPDRGLPA